MFLCLFRESRKKTFNIIMAATLKYLPLVQIILQFHSMLYCFCSERML